MTWNLDMTTAPLGKLVTVTRTVKGEPKNYDEYHVAPIWIATSKGGVQRSYWVPATKTSEGRWAGFSAGSDEPVAWQEFVVPTHPFQAKASDEACETAPYEGRAEASADASDGVELVSRVVGDRAPTATTEYGRDSLERQAPSIPELHVFLEDVGGSI